VGYVPWQAKVQVSKLRIFFTRNDPDQRLANRFIWFKKWILEQQTFKTLSRDNNLSIDTLQRIFYTYLEKSPTKALQPMVIKVSSRSSKNHYQMYWLSDA
jgi:transcriptional regulator GlxA family with amidase domain